MVLDYISSLNLCTINISQIFIIDIKVHYGSKKGILVIYSLSQKWDSSEGEC